MLNNNFGTIINLLLVGIIWGSTNPFIKIGTKGVENVRAKNKVIRIWKEIIFLVTNSKYIIPFMINQTGSILYYYTLQSSNLTLAVPISNSLAFAFTALIGWFLNEKMTDTRGMLGIILVSAGISCFILNSIN